MPPKRKRQTKKSAGPQTKKRGRTTATLKKIVVQALARNMETKTSNYTSSDGSEIGHNSFITMDLNVLETSQGTSDSMTSGSGNRIGDEITLKGISMKFMVELNERYSDVTFRLFVVKAAKGDTLSDSTFFTGLSGNRMIDTINKERFTVLYSKTFKVTAPNKGTLQTVQGTGSGLYGVGNSSANQGDVLSRATRIIKVYIPGTKLARSRKIVYENASTQPKFFDYKVLLFAYSNWSTSATLGYNVARLNDYVRQIYYTDA